MEAEVLKSELHAKIDQADKEQLEQLYGLVLNYLNGQSDTEEWDSLPQYQQDELTRSLAQADAGLHTPVEDVVKRIREKYGLNE